MNDLSEKVIVIMGASSGIGEATTKLLAEKGAKLVIAARREDRLKAIKESLPEAELYIQTADVRDFAQVQAVIDLAMEKFGRIDVLYNNAGIMPTAPLVEGHRDEWQNMLDINIMGVLNGISAVLPIMEKQKSGHIISTDSVAGHVVYPDSAVYCGTNLLSVQSWKDYVKSNGKITSNLRSSLQELFKLNYIKPSATKRLLLNFMKRKKNGD